MTQSEIEQALRAHPHIFEFFQAVRLLEQLSRGLREPVGQFSRPEREAVRFRVNNTLAFPASQIQDLEWPPDGQPRMRVNFMGLTGPSGVLPYAFTEFLIERSRAKDRSLEAFFDLFHHRMISLFYQAWEKYRFPVAYERDQQDQFSRHILALIGLGTSGLQNRQAVPDHALGFYAGLLSLQPRSPSALEQVLADYFGVPAEVEQFVGAWYPLQRGDQCCFNDGMSLSEQLGVGVIVGDAVWDQQCRVRVKLGPLSAERYLDFLPGGKAYEPLRALTAFFGRGDVEFEVQLILKHSDVPACQLGVDISVAPQLGWFSWMKSKPTFDRDPSDTILFLN